MFYLSNCDVPLLFCFVNSFIAGLLVITSAVVKFRFISANFFIVISYSYLTIVYFLWYSAEVSSDSCKKKELFWIKLSTKNGYHSECPIQIKFSVQQIPRCQNNSKSKKHFSHHKVPKLLGKLTGTFFNSA